MTATTLPLTYPSDTTRLAERLAARALRRSLVPGTPALVVARELYSLAGGQWRPINDALRRIERAQTDGGCSVVDQAALYLLAALELSRGATSAKVASTSGGGAGAAGSDRTRARREAAAGRRPPVGTERTPPRGGRRPHDHQRTASLLASSGRA